MSNQLTAKNTFLLKVGSAPSATEVVTTSKDVIISPKAKTIEYSDIGSGKRGNVKTVTVSDWTTADFSVEVKARASGAAGTAPKIAHMLKACGLGETIVASTSVTYAPSSSFTAATAKGYVDGYKRDITGIAGNFTFGGSVGDFVNFNFALKGFTTLTESAEANPAVTLDANKLFIIESITAFTIAGTEIDIKSFEFDLGNDIQETYAANIKEYYIKDFKPTIKVSAIKTAGNQTHWSDLTANTKKELKVVLGTAAGNKLTLTASFCNPMDVSESDDNGKVAYDATWLCENSAGSDNFSLKYE